MSILLQKVYSRNPKVQFQGVLVGYLLCIGILKTMFSSRGEGIRGGYQYEPVYSGEGEERLSHKLYPTGDAFSSKWGIWP
jgi:hypothetical protein